jgi:hypothetical protein
MITASWTSVVTLTDVPCAELGVSVEIRTDSTMTVVTWTKLLQAFAAAPTFISILSNLE